MVGTNQQCNFQLSPNDKEFDVDILTLYFTNQTLKLTFNLPLAADHISSQHVVTDVVFVLRAVESVECPAGDVALAVRNMSLLTSILRALLVLGV